MLRGEDIKWLSLVSKGNDFHTCAMMASKALCAQLVHVVPCSEPADELCHAANYIRLFLPGHAELGFSPLK